MGNLPSGSGITGDAAAIDPLAPQHRAWAGPGIQPGPDLSRIHRAGLTDPWEIGAFLAKARDLSVTLESGLGRQLDRERAWVDSVEPGSVWLRIQNFDLDRRERIALTCSLAEDTYIFQTELLETHPSAERIRVTFPGVLYRVERRERLRRRPDDSARVPSRATIRWQQIEIGDARVVDYSEDGVALMLRSTDAPSVGSTVQLSFVDGPEPEAMRTGWVKRRVAEPTDSGWQRVGLAITAAPPGPLLPIERRKAVLNRASRTILRDRWQMFSGGARIALRRGLERLGVDTQDFVQPEVLRFPNSSGEQIVALCDSFRPGPGVPVVIMPPAWAKTKETLLPLARTIVATFQRANQPISVIRLDGIRRRGESFNDPDCRTPGRECHHMTFSQGVADVQATLDFVEHSPQFRSSRIVLVTFSGASIEVRKVLASEASDRVCGWVSVVGAADLKSGLRTVSGGQDYIGGCERGVRFGIQRVLGIETDADLVCRDALDNELAHLEDARRQMAQVRVPITWIQGRHDAWIDPSRVREILSCGDASRRKLVEVPTGHQLRTSREALDSFQLVASEIGRFVTGRPLPPALPDLAELEQRRRAERDRLPRTRIDLRQFWHEYMLGRDGRLGMDLLTATTPYRELMAAQVQSMSLRPGDRVADLGSGTGSLPRFLRSELGLESRVEIHEFDFLRDAFDALRRRIDETSRAPGVRFVKCDLNLDRRTRHIPVRDGSYDAALASLLVNYLERPERLLAEARRILRPGGRFVLSVLRKDTDISKIYQDAASEIRAGVTRDALGGLGVEEVEESVRSFLNEAARLLDLEEQGLFHFWEPEEIASLARAAGFGSVRTQLSFGDPPQAIIVFAEAD